MRYLLVLCLFLASFAASSEDRVFDTKKNRFLTVKEFADLIPPRGQVVMGEYHYQGNIQKAQGVIIQAIVDRHFRYDNFSVSWEFLNYTDQTAVAESFLAYRNGEFDALELFKKWFPAAAKPEQNLPYKAFVDVTSKNGGEVIAVNAPRKYKRVITAGGIDALDRDLLPPTYEIGSDNYLKRFKEAMGGHVPEDKIRNYFEAQCYTDTVMAHQMMAYSAFDLQFLIVGAFHSDYLDGVVREMGKTHAYETTTVKIVDKAELDITTYREILFGSRSYGRFADYIFFTNWK